MSIASEITRLQNAKADIKTAIEAKGVTVPSSAKIDTYDTYVSQISGGGGTDRLPQLLNGTITSISASDFVNTTEVKPYAFYKLTNLSSVTLPNNLTKLGDRAFSGCTSLTSIVLPDTITNSTSNGEVSVFENCNALTSVNIPQNSSYNAIGNGFFNDCTSLRSITIPSNITRIGGSAFYGSGITSITIPSSVTSLGTHLFSYCHSLTTATLYGGNDGWSSAFVNCENLVSVTFNWNITWKNVGNNLFDGCSSLSSLTLPATIIKLGNYCLRNTTSLTAIDFEGTMAQ